VFVRFVIAPHEDCYFVSIDELNVSDLPDFLEASNGPPKRQSSNSNSEINRIRDELRLCQKDLEESYIESQSLMEELQSTNEELLSANEELETANEELQVLNNDMYSSNELLRQKNKHLIDLKNSLLESQVRMEEAQEADKMGFWEYDIEDNKITISSGLRKILFINDDEIIPSPVEFFEKFGIELDKRKELSERVARILETGVPEQFTTRSEINGIERYLYLHIWVIKDKDGKPIKLAGIDRDVTEIELTNQKLAANELRYRHLFDSSPVGLFVCDYSRVKKHLDSLTKKAVQRLLSLTEKNFTEIQRLMRMTIIRDVNKEALDMFEAESKESLILNIESSYTQRSMESFIDVITSFIGGETRIKNETMFLRFNGTYLNSIRITERSALDSNWENVIVSLTDISSRKDAEQKLAESESRLNLAQNLAELGNWEWRRKGSTMHRSAQFDKIMGLRSTDELSLKLFTDLLDPRDLAKFNAALKAANAGKSEFIYDFKFIHKESEIILHTITLVEFDQNGELEKAYGTIQDITQVRNDEIRLEIQNKILNFLASDASFTNAIEYIISTIEAVYPDLILVYCEIENNCLKPISSDRMDLKFLQALDGFPVQKNIGTCGAAISQKKRVIDVDIHTSSYWRTLGDVIKDLNIRSCWSQPVYNKTKDVVGTSAIYFREKRKPTARDFELMDTISYLIELAQERQRHNFELLENELKWKKLVETGFDGVLLIDKDGFIKYANPVFTKIFGYDQEDLVGLTARSTLFEGDSEILTTFLEGFKETPNKNIRFEHRAFHKDGTLRWVEISSTNCLDDPTLAGVVSVFRDITDRKISEMMIRESSEELEFSLEAANMGTWSYTYRTLKVNESAIRLLGLKTHPKTLEGFVQHIAKQDQLSFLQSVEKLRGTWAFESEVHIQNSSKRWVQFRMKSVVEDGRTVGFRGVVIDITELKNYESMLLESEQRWSYALEGNQDGVWDWNVETGEVFITDQCKRIFGFEPSEAPNLSVEWSSRIHPNDQKIVQENIRKHVNGESDYYINEYRILCKDGTYKWVLVRGKLIQTGNGELERRLVGTLADISKRKEFELELELSDQLLKAINSLQLDLISGTAVENAIYRTLIQIGKIIDADRIQIYKSIEPSGVNETISLLHEWTNGILEARQGTTQHSAVYFQDFGYDRWATLLKKNIPISGHVSKLPASEHEALLKQGIHSLFVTPIFYKDQFWGFIEFDVLKADKLWTNSEYQLLKNFANTFAEIMMNREAEEAIEVQRKRIETTINSIADAVITVGLNGEILLINPLAEKLLGYKQAGTEYLSNYLVLLDKQNKQPLRDPLAKLYAGTLKTPTQVSGIFVDSNGVSRTLQGSVSPIFNRQSDLNGAVVALTDVTNFEKMETELQKAQKLESIGILAGGIAHDFNNILTGIIGNLSLAELYLDDNDTKAIQERIELATEGCIRAGDLTQQLLTFSKGGSPIKKVVNIKELLEKATSFAIHGTKVQSLLSFEPELYSVEADEGQLNQVVNNLIINATQAMPDGGRVFVVADNLYISSANLQLNEGFYVRIKITDEGVGIPKEYLEQIFDPFFTTKEYGSGLGLATSFSIIKRHEGQIDVESTVDEGTTFTIYLPATTEQVTEVFQAKQSMYKGVGRVLVLDDDVAILELLEKALIKMGFDVVVKTSGNEVISLFREAEESNPFTLVILDLTVPGEKGGVEVIKELKEINPSVKAIVSSGYSNVAAISKYKSFGFMARIIKPFTAKQLSAVIEKILD
jgi:PAS domain S-box-containing protein